MRWHGIAGGDVDPCDEACITQLHLRRKGECLAETRVQQRLANQGLSALVHAEDHRLLVLTRSRVTKLLTNTTGIVMAGENERSHCDPCRRFTDVARKDRVAARGRCEHGAHGTRGFVEEVHAAERSLNPSNVSTCSIRREDHHATDRSHDFGARTARLDTRHRHQEETAVASCAMPQYDTADPSFLPACALRRRANRMTQHAGAINAVAFTADGAQLLSASSDGTIRAWALPRDKR